MNYFRRFGKEKFRFGEGKFGESTTQDLAKESLANPARPGQRTYDIIYIARVRR